MSDPKAGQADRPAEPGGAGRPSGSALRVAAAQLGAASEDLDENLGRVLATIERAAAESVDWLCLPELALTPYFCHDDTAPSEWFLAADSPVLSKVCAAARSARMGTVLPFAEAAGPRRYNSAAVIDPQGEVRGVYRKIHLPRAEQRHFDPGGRLDVSDVDGVRAGVLVCADRSFLEAWRTLGVRGARLVFAPYGTTALGGYRSGLGCPEGMDRSEWMRQFQELRVRASASLNGFFVVGAGKAGVERGTRYLGDSMVVSPWGNVVARAASDGDELVLADIDLAVAEEYRATGYYERRVPAAYDEALGG